MATRQAGIRLRQGRPDDHPALMNLLAQNDMVGEISPDDCLLAEKGNRLLGFVRVELDQKIPYLRPVVVASDCRKQGVGRRLVQQLLTEFPELRVVARGQAVDFYERLGFETFEWTELPLRFYRECELCPDLELCNPVPMRYGGRESTNCE